MKKLFFLFFGISVHGQQLHHQMLSSQGTSSLLSNGILVKQTIGQQSVTGNFNFSNSVIGQGFQQSKVSKAKPSIIKNEFTTITYPNPFIDQLNFNFSNKIIGPVTISIFDISGRLVYNQQKEVSQNLLTIKNLHFAAGAYFVKLEATNYSHFTNIIQSK